jgi:hypothetical protein
MKAATIGVLVIGLLFVGLSGLWSSLFPATRAWTPEKSQRLGQVKDRMTNISFIINNPNYNRDKTSLNNELEKLTKEDEELTAEFNSATARPNTVSKFLKWAGISMALVGIVGWYATNQSR